MKSQTVTEQMENLSQELRRGALPLAVLSMLGENKYGYALINDLEERGIKIDQGTLYPMLRRLEEQGLLQSSWILEGSRPRRYYQISENGLVVLASLSADWRDLNQVIEKILAEKPVK
jgi:PadR family transcriptional regulator, regulatory protein PadR